MTQSEQVDPDAENTAENRSTSRSPDAVLDEHAGDERTGKLNRAMGTGVRWMAPTQVTVQIVRIGSMLVLTRLLTPRDFGLVALVTVITGFFERVLGDTGTTVALVRNPRLTQGLASSVFYWNVAIGLFTTAFLAVWAAPIARALGDASATDIVRVVGLLALVNSFTHLPNALFRRRMQFRQLAAVNLTNAVITAAASIALAVLDFGVWSLVWGNIAGSAAAVVLSWSIVRWRPSRYFSRKDMSEISGFSTNLSIQNVFGYVSYAGDRFIIGRFIGTTALGYYGLANRLMRYPVQTSAQTYRDVMFPSLAKIQSDPAAMTAAYTRSIGGISLLLFPLCATVAAVAQPLVAVMLGPKWAPTADIIGIIAITSALQAISSTTGSLYNARGRADLSLRWQIGSSIFLVIAYSIGSAYGVVGVAWGYLIGTALLVPLAFWIPLRLIGANLFHVTRSAIAAGAAAGVAALAANGAVRLLAAQDSSSLVQLLVGCFVSLAVYGLYIAAFRPRAARDVLAMVRR